MNIRCVTIGFVAVVTNINPTFAHNDKAQDSWKYLVQRTIAKKDNITGKKEVHTDRAFVHYGSGAEEAGGQIKEVPQVIYINKNQKPLAKASYYASPFVPRRIGKLTMSNKFPYNLGSNKNSPLPVDGLPNVFDIFPLKTESKLEQGKNWNVTWHLYRGMNTQITFPATISHRVTGYERKLGRRCAVIKYTIKSEFKSADHPELFTEEQRRELRGEYHLKGEGTAYFDSEENIILDKKQTMSWTSFGEKLSRLKDGNVGWVTKEDKERTVTINVSLVTDEQPESTHQEIVYTEEQTSSNHRAIVYIVIAAGVAALLTLFFIIRKKKFAS